MTEGPELTPEDVQEILRLVDEAGYAEFELETPRFSLRLTPRREAAAEPPTAAGALSANNVVDVGTAVEPETQVCILEVMKLMNAVVAGVSGVVAEICRKNGEPVEYGDVLLRIRPGG